MSPCLLLLERWYRYTTESTSGAAVSSINDVLETKGCMGGKEGFTVVLVPVCISLPGIKGANGATLN